MNASDLTKVLPPAAARRDRVPAAAGDDHVSGKPALELRDVWARYPEEHARLRPRPPGLNAGRYALQGVSLEVAEGQYVAIVGPNGAGKSTLLKLVVGLLSPSRGQVIIFGLEPERHKCVGYVPQRHQLDWSFPLTVEDVVMMGRVGRIGLLRWPGRQDRQLVRASLERVGLAALSNAAIGQLSGGQQQRVFIARALAQGADLLLLDEPFSGLDTPSHSAILETLADLRYEGVTVLLATHDLRLAAEHFDLVALLNRRLITFGPPEQALDLSQLLAAYGGQAKLVPGEAGDVILTDGHCEDGSPELVG
ncbi:MAG: metal ABC transporter ATP-binding protein [Candidatus Promineifilaceae bacterium]